MSAAVSPIFLLLLSDSVKFCIPFRGKKNPNNRTNPKHPSQRIIQFLPLPPYSLDTMWIQKRKKKKGGEGRKKKEDVSEVMFLLWALATHFSSF